MLNYYLKPTAMAASFYPFAKKVFPSLLIFIRLLSANNTLAQQPVVSLTPVINTGLNQPIQLVNADDGTGRVFIVEKGGSIKIYDASFNFLSDFLTVDNLANGGEQGLLSMAFHPDYENNGFFYVYYTNADDDLELARYHVSSNPNQADAASKVILLTILHPTYLNHNGGELHFGPDGFLYLSTGDGGSGGDPNDNAQRSSELLGKLLRLNVNTSAAPPYYSIPSGNPFNNEVYSLGLRNPFRWSFDRLTNDIWIGDVGQESFEEINFRAAGTSAGANYGWRCYEGNAEYNTTGCLPASNYIFPVLAYPTPNPSAAVTGGMVYRGSTYPALQGYYVATDFYSGIFYLINPDGAGGWTTTTQAMPVTGVADFGETENGEAYVVSLTANTVYRLEGASGPLPVTLKSLSGIATGEMVKLSWQTTVEINLQQFEVQYSLNSMSFETAGMVVANDAAGGADYSFNHQMNSTGTVYYRLKMLDKDGGFRYSDIIKIVMGSQNAKPVAPTVISDGYLRINLANSTYLFMELINSAGRRVLKKIIEGQTGRLELPIGKLPSGIYLVRFSGRGTTVTEKILIQ